MEADGHTYRGNKRTNIHAVGIDTGWAAGLCLPHCLESLEEAFLNSPSEFHDDSLRIFDFHVISSSLHTRTSFGHINRKSGIYVIAKKVLRRQIDPVRILDNGHRIIMHDLQQLEKLSLDEGTGPETHDGIYTRRAIYLERHIHGGILTRLIIQIVGAYTRRDIQPGHARRNRRMKIIHTEGYKDKGAT